MAETTRTIPELKDCSRLITWYRVRVRVLTPIHIGCGEKAIKDYDYVVVKIKGEDVIFPIDLEEVGRWALEEGLDLVNWNEVINNVCREIENGNLIDRFRDETRPIYAICDKFGRPIDPKSLGIMSSGGSSSPGQGQSGRLQPPKTLQHVLSQPPGLRMMYLFYLCFKEWPPPGTSTGELQRRIKKKCPDLLRKFIESQKTQSQTPSPSGPQPSIGKGPPGAAIDLDRLNEYHLFIRDGLGRPYLPGSSIKGALRTVVAAFRDYIVSRNNRPDRVYTHIPKKRNRQGKLVRVNPTADIGRLFLVRDAYLDPADLCLVNIKAVTMGKGLEGGREGRGARAEIPVRVEAIRPDAEIEFLVGISHTLELHREHFGQIQDSDQNWLWGTTTKGASEGFSPDRYIEPQGWEKGASGPGRGAGGGADQLKRGVANWWTLIGDLCPSQQEGPGLLRKYNERMLDFLRKQADRLGCPDAASWYQEYYSSADRLLRIGFGSGWPGMTGIPGMNEKQQFPPPHVLQSLADDVGRTHGPHRNRVRYGSGQIHFPVSVKLAKLNGQLLPMGWMEVIGCEQQI